MNAFALALRQVDNSPDMPYTELDVFMHQGLSGEPGNGRGP